MTTSFEKNLLTEEWNDSTTLLRYDRLFGGAGLDGTALTVPFRDPKAHHVFHQYVLRARRRDELREFLTAAKSGVKSTTRCRFISNPVLGISDIKRVFSGIRESCGRSACLAHVSGTWRRRTRLGSPEYFGFLLLEKHSPLTSAAPTLRPMMAGSGGAGCGLLTRCQYPSHDR